MKANTPIYFDDIIKTLTDKGYAWTSEGSLYDIDLIGEKYENIPMANFLIDEVYCCKDKELDEVSYIFAISSIEEKLKFIVINVITKETSITIGDILAKIKHGVMNLLKLK